MIPGINASVTGPGTWTISKAIGALAIKEKLTEHIRERLPQ